MDALQPKWMREGAKESSTKVRLVTVSVVAILAIVVLAASVSLSSASQSQTPLQRHHPHFQRPGGWQFDVARDARNLGMSEWQCDIAFPRLYEGLDETRDHLGLRSVSQNQLAILQNHTIFSHSQLRVLIHSGQMYIIDEKLGACNRARALAGLSSLYRAIISIPDPRTLPNVEFTIDIEDTPTHEAPANRVVWGWTRPYNNSRTWLMPDFDGWAFPNADLGSYISFRSRLPQYEKPFSSKDARAVWRGSISLNKVRKALINATQGADWADVLDMGRHPENRMHMAEFCGYQFPIHTEGNSWSGRLRYLHNCASATIIHNLTFNAHYYHLLQPDGLEQNYIPARNDWTDLSATMAYYRAHPEEAERIANMSASTFRDRYLTPAAEACYWRAMVRRWKQVQNFEPEAYYQPSGTKEWKQRGVDWEVFVAPDPAFPVVMPQATSY